MQGDELRGDPNQSKRHCPNKSRDYGENSDDGSEFDNETEDDLHRFFGGTAAWLMWPLR